MRRTVLLVEDEAKLADVLAEQLAQEDFDVRLGRSLRQSLRMLDDLVPDVAVIDIGLPDGSGLDVLRRLRCGADRLDSGTPVIVLTARTEEADVLRAFERGADDYLRKPIVELSRARWSGTRCSSGSASSVPARTRASARTLGSM
jgi:DNA-binding response OmpR family regulator